jgi:hypothetical protein
MDQAYELQFSFVKSELKLGWRIDGRTGADGNCFYISIVQQLKRPDVKNFLLQSGMPVEFLSFSPSTLREHLCDWLNYQLTLKNSAGKPLTRIGQYLIESEVIDIETSSYWKAKNVTKIEKFLKIQREGCEIHGDMAWANNIIVGGMAYYLNINIKIATKTPRAAWVNTISIGPNMDKVTDVFMTIANLNQTHFQSYIPNDQLHPAIALSADVRICVLEKKPKIQEGRTSKAGIVKKKNISASFTNTKDLAILVENTKNSKKSNNKTPAKQNTPTKKMAVTDKKNQSDAPIMDDKLTTIGSAVDVEEQKLDEYPNTALLGDTKGSSQQIKPIRTARTERNRNGKSLENAKVIHNTEVDKAPKTELEVGCVSKNIVVSGVDPIVGDKCRRCLKELKYIYLHLIHPKNCLCKSMYTNDELECYKRLKNKLNYTPTTINKTECKGCLKNLTSMSYHFSTKKGKNCKKKYSISVIEDIKKVENKQLEENRRLSGVYKRKEVHKKLTGQNKKKEERRKITGVYKQKEENRKLTGFNKKKEQTRKLSGHNRLKEAKRNKCGINKKKANKMQESGKNKQKNFERKKHKILYTDEKIRFRQFITAIRDGPTYVCISCKRLLFRNGVKKINLKSIQTKFKKEELSTMLYSLRNENETNDIELMLCLNCLTYYKKGKIPAINVTNGLEIEQLKQPLTELEECLIARNIPFAKIYLLPKTRMSAIIDKVINVPICESDINRTISLFPRTPSEALILPIKLKRKKQYKNSVAEAYIRPYLILQAITDLKNNNPFYYNINIRDNYEANCKATDTIAWDMLNPPEEPTLGVLLENVEESSDEEEKFEIQYQEKDAVKKYQSLVSESYVMTSNSPESDVVTNLTSQKLLHLTPDGKDIIIAPGEGKIPTNFLREQNWDVKSFPSLHATGKFGLNFARKKKLSPQQYLNQRLLNENRAFSRNKQFVFAFVNLIERHQLENAINISYRHGSVSNLDGKKELAVEQDGFSVFQKIKGTPKYWKQARYELIAKQEQLGPFQIFFTLSCADKRWSETFATILAQKGHKVTYMSEIQDINSECISEGQITIDDLPIEDFLEEESLHDLIKNDVLTITRIFDHRVKMFINHIVMGKNNSMKVIFFNYRVEFQARGMGHIHGVLWCDLTEVEREAFNKVFSSEFSDTDEEFKTVVNFIEKFTTCGLPEDNTLKKIVKEVQTHNHTKACQKYENNCRFGFPKFPSEKTIIAKQLESDVPNRQEIINKNADILSLVSKILQSSEFDDNMSLTEILGKAYITTEEYYAALQMSSMGNKIVLKRTPKEIWINNYNPEWLRAWNGNMDIQVCTDIFAVVTYITDYYSKSETAVMEHWLKAWNESKSMDFKSRLHNLKDTFLTHRKMGECEAFYRVLPALHLKDSNIKCVFVTSGFPENRSKFLLKVNDNEIDSVDSTDVIFVKNREGKFREQTTVHNYYALRPKSLEDVCLAQFATHYKMGNSNKENIRHYEKEGHLKSFFSESFLPKYVKVELLNERTVNMSLRSKPAVMRLHKFKETEDFHQFMYSEMLLFYHWRNEKQELKYESPTECKLVYESAIVQSTIEKNKKGLYPFREMMPEIEEILERYQQLDTTQVGQSLDAEGEKDNVESNDLGFEENEDLSFMKAYDLSEVQQPVTSTHNTFAAYNALSKEEIFQKAQTLSWDQQLAFQLILKYFKQCLKNHNGNKQKPIAPLLFIHGAGGSGKSMLINLLSEFGEHFFRKIKAGSQNKPVVLKTAPTGKAASNIGGYTLHSTFSLSFGNKFMSLNDEKKATLSSVLEDLQVLFIDEISMVKPDLLYQLHLRLKEVKNVDKPFGNVCIIILGDLMQLKPVQGNYVFDMPRCIDFKSYHTQWPLFEQFSIVELITNHRQGSDKKYAELLERVRFGRQTEADIELLQSKIITEDNLICTDALMIYGTNAAVNRFNAKMLSLLPADVEEIAAVKIPPRSNKYYRFPVNKEGLIGETTFYNVLKLKNNSSVMLTYNVNTGDKLTNGQLGKITQIIKSASTKEVICVMIEFEDKSVGQQQKEKYKKYAKMVGVPIFRINFTYSIGKKAKDHIATAQIIQFPLKLAWALTCHKVQGQTIKKPNKMVSDLATIFQANQAYVVLSRVQSIEQIYFTRCPAKKIYCSDVCRKKCDQIKQNSLNETSNPWGKNAAVLKVSSINIRSLNAHVEDLKHNYFIMQSDIICVQETWVEESDDINKYVIEGFQLICSTTGKGKGAGMYLKKTLQAQTEIHTNMSVQLVKMEHECFDLITVYFNCKTDIEEAISYMTKVMNKEKKTFIIGDFNTGTTQKLKFLILKMNQIGFQLLLKEASHESGNTLDNLITNAKDIKDLNLFLYSLYFTDHDSLCFTISNVH